VLDDEGDRIGVDRIGTNPVAVGYRLSLCASPNSRRRQPPDLPKQRALGDRRGGEPGLERFDRIQIGAALRQPQLGAAGVRVVLAALSPGSPAQLCRNSARLFVSTERAK
jgi:hypothetical protein